MKIVFTGDFSISGSFLNSVKMERTIIDQKILDIFLDSDIVHINLENPISDQSFRQKKGISLKAPPNIIKYLRGYNISVCNLANNHIMDCGESGLLDTIDLLESNEIHYYGIGPYKKYLLIKDEDISIALISSCSSWGGKEGPVFDKTNIAPYNFCLAEVKEIVDDIKSNFNIDIIIYNYHGGTEFNIIPEPKRRKFLKDIINVGVDLVVGHHAHVPQGVEYVNKSIILYGLGNFCFDLPYHRNNRYTSESFFVQIVIDKNSLIVNKYFYKIDLENGKTILDTSCSEVEAFIEESKEIFKNEKKYIEAWRQECFRIYLKPLINIYKTTTHDKSDNNYSDIKNNKNIYVKSIFWLKNSFISDIKNECRRQFILGSIIYMLKQKKNRII